MISESKSVPATIDDGVGVYSGNKGGDEDELESLMADLQGSDSGANSKPPPADDEDELDSLMESLAAPSQQSSICILTYSDFLMMQILNMMMMTIS